MNRRNPEQTRARILAAAMREFVAKGVAGARVDAIADAAQTNKRMLYYYFGSKAELFREVLTTQLQRRTELLRAQTQPSDQPSDQRPAGAQAGAFAGTWRTLLADPPELHLADTDYVRLLQWEALEADGLDDAGQGPDGESPADAARQQAYARWVATIQAEQAAGRFPADLDPGQYALSELALVLFPAAFPKLTRWLCGHDPNDPEFVRARGEFLAALAARMHADPSA